MDPDENKCSPRPFILPKGVDNAPFSFDATFSVDGNDTGFVSVGLLLTAVVSGVELFEKGFFGACLGIGGSGADEGVNFCAEFFAEGIEITVSLFFPVGLENGFDEDLSDKGGKAIVSPVLRFVCPSFDRALTIEIGTEFDSFLLMSIAAFNFSGVVPKLARVSRDELGNVVCFNSSGASNDNRATRFSSTVDG